MPSIDVVFLSFDKHVYPTYFLRSNIITIIKHNAGKKWLIMVSKREVSLTKLSQVEVPSIK